MLRCPRGHMDFLIGIPRGDPLGIPKESIGILPVGIPKALWVCNQDIHCSPLFSPSKWQVHRESKLLLPSFLFGEALLLVLPQSTPDFRTKKAALSSFPRPPSKCPRFPFWKGSFERKRVRTAELKLMLLKEYTKESWATCCKREDVFFVFWKIIGNLFWW